MRSEEEIRARIDDLEEVYDRHDPPSSELEDETEIAVLRAIEELQWVLGEHDDDDGFTV